MADTVTVQELAAEVRKRLDAIASQAEGQATKDELAALEAKLDDQRIEELVQKQFASLLEGEESSAVVRKIVFGRESDPALIGSKYAQWGVTPADLEMAHDILESAQRKGLSTGPSEELRNVVKQFSTARRVTDVQARAEDEAKIEQMKERGLLTGAAYDQARAALEQVHGRAMDTAESGFGQQLIGAQYVAELWRGARAKSRVLSLIRTFPMTDPTAFLPVEAGLPELLFVGESVDNNSANYTTVKTGSQRVQVDAKKFVIHQMWSGELEEDSIIPFVAFLREQASRSLAHYGDSLVLNGDTTNAGTGNINLDDADPADTKHYLAFDGIRHAALVDNTGNGFDVAGPITFATLLQEPRGRMIDTARLHDWGHPDVAEDLVYVADPETSDRISLLEEVLTVDKFGAQATVLTGQQARVGPHPLIASQAVSKTEADGKVSTTANNNTKGQVVVFNRGGFVVGERRAVKVETERIPATDQNRIVYSLREGFGRFTPTGAASGIEAASVLYDISL